MVRTLQVADLPELCRFGEANYLKVKPFNEKFNSSHFSGVLRDAIRQDVAVVWVSEFVGVWGSILGASFSKDLFTGSLTAYGQFWFCPEAFRGSGHGFRVFDAFMNEAKRRKCRKILMGHPDTINRDAGKAFFKRNGFVWVENLYQKELND